MIIKTFDGEKTMRILSYFPEWNEIKFERNVDSVIKG